MFETRNEIQGPSLLGIPRETVVSFVIQYPNNISLSVMTFRMRTAAQHETAETLNHVTLKCL